MQGISLTNEELKKLLSCGCPDAVVLYLYRKSAAPLEMALDALHFTVPRMVAATDCLRQLGLWEEAIRKPIQPERPTYSDEDLHRALRSKNDDFPKLVGEAQRKLARPLSTEELKTLLSFTDYLRLPMEVVGVLLHYCVERGKRRGSRTPSMRTIEKEAYRWADENIDSLEAACYYVQNQLIIHTRIQKLRLLMQIDQRRLTSTEEQYLTNWIESGFSDDVIHMAYERTCLNTGALKWNYMNSILRSWKEKGLMTPQQIEQGDLPPQSAAKGKPVKGKQFLSHGQELSPMAKKALAQAKAEMQEDPNGIQ